MVFDGCHWVYVHSTSQKWGGRTKMKFTALDKCVIILHLKSAACFNFLSKWELTFANLYRWKEIYNNTVDIIHPTLKSVVMAIYPCDAVIWFKKAKKALSHIWVVPNNWPLHPLIHEVLTSNILVPNSCCYFKFSTLS